MRVCCPSSILYNVYEFTSCFVIYAILVSYVPYLIRIKLKLQGIKLYKSVPKGIKLYKSVPKVNPSIVKAYIFQVDLFNSIRTLDDVKFLCCFVIANEPISEPMMTCMHIWVTRPRWVYTDFINWYNHFPHVWLTGETATNHDIIHSIFCQYLHLIREETMTLVSCSGSIAWLSTNWCLWIEEWSVNFTQNSDSIRILTGILKFSIHPLHCDSYLEDVCISNAKLLMHALTSVDPRRYNLMI